MTIAGNAVQRTNAAPIFASIAGAHYIYITYTGVIKNGYDQSGLFGPANSKLSGDAFSITYKFDAQLGRRSYTSSQNFQYGGMDYYLRGGSAYKLTTPLVSATITIDGHSQAMTAPTGAETTLSVVRKRNGSISYEMDQDIYANTTSGNDEISNSLDTSIYGTASGLSAAQDLSGGGSSLFSANIGAQSHPAGYFSFGTYDDSAGDQTVNTYASLSLSTVSLSVGNS